MLKIDKRNKLLRFKKKEGCQIDSWEILPRWNFFEGSIILLPKKAARTEAFTAHLEQRVEQ